jgi:hypothetical protein
MKGLRFGSIGLIVLLTVPFAVGQTGAAGSGHWEGTIQLPKKALKIAVDLAQDPKGEWTGSVEIPEQKLNLAVSDIAVNKPSVSFNSKEWLLAVEGELSPDGKSIKGGFTSAFLLSVPVPMELQWVSRPAVKGLAGSTGISGGLEGTWEGVVTLGSAWEDGNPSAGSTTTVRVRLANGPSGIATGGLSKSGAPDSVPLSAIGLNGNTLRFELNSAGVVYVGELKGGQLIGEWNQFGLDPVPLTLKHINSK